jgi:hypothetical protein
MDSPQNAYSFAQSVDRSLMLRYSEWLREDVASRVPLFRNRFALDDALGIHASFYSIMTKRSDTYVDPLPDAQQSRIFQDEASYWNLFVIHDKQTFKRDMADYSAVGYLAKYAQERGINIVFLMVPTFVDKIARDTVISRSDLVTASHIYRDIARSYGAGYIDYLDNQTLLPYMYHFDNITAAGQKKMGELLTKDLPPVLFRKGHP